MANNIIEYYTKPVMYQTDKPTPARRDLWVKFHAVQQNGTENYQKDLWFRFDEGSLLLNDDPKQYDGYLLYLTKDVFSTEKIPNIKDGGIVIGVATVDNLSQAGDTTTAIPGKILLTLAIPENNIKLPS